MSPRVSGRCSARAGQAVEGGAGRGGAELKEGRGGAGRSGARRGRDEWYYVVGQDIVRGGEVLEGEVARWEGKQSKQGKEEGVDGGGGGPGAGAFFQLFICLYFNKKRSDSDISRDSYQ